MENPDKAEQPLQKPGISTIVQYVEIRDYGKIKIIRKSGLSGAYCTYM